MEYKRTMRRRYFLVMIGLWSVLYILQFLYYHMIMDDKNLDMFFFPRSNQAININRGFSHFQIFEAKHREIELENKYQVTAIILHWKRLSGVQTLIEYYLKASLFKQIIVWNNNPQLNLTLNQLLPTNSSSHLIRIINSNKNLKDEAKYRACSEAQTSVCFYADDDWDISHYIKCLIASFRSDPNLLHSVTDPYTFYTNLIWSYFDSTIDLHTGFSWIGYGSIFLREHARRHLQLLEIYLYNDRNLIAFSDIFFSIWLNDIPSQMNADIRLLPAKPNEYGGPFSATSNFAEMQQKGSILAIQILEHSLRFNLSNTTITFPRQSYRRFPYYIRSPSRNDDLIFYTNVLPMDIKHIPFNISRDSTRGTRQNLPRGEIVDNFTDHTTLKAVDNENPTCWYSNPTIKIGEFFAIDFLRIQTNITFALIVAHSYSLQTSLDMGVSLDGLRWISYRSLEGIITLKTNQTGNEYRYKMIFNSTQFALGFNSFRYVMFNATSSSNMPFNICEVELINGDTNKLHLK